jgi:hypothetical protein
VAILTFSGAAPHLKQREKWVGWSARQRARRLGFVINNSWFLLLVERERHPNLASKILGLALRRVAQDWQERWDSARWWWKVSWTKAASVAPATERADSSKSE